MKTEKALDTKRQFHLVVQAVSCMWTSFFEVVCGGNGLLTEAFYSIFLFERLHNLYLGAVKILKHCLI